MMFIMMIVVVMIMLTAYTQNTYGPNTNRYIFRFLRWSLGLIFHQCWVDCARALLLVPLGRSLLLCAPVIIIVFIVIIIKIIIEIIIIIMGTLFASVIFKIFLGSQMFSPRDCFSPSCHSA